MQFTLMRYKAYNMYSDTRVKLGWNPTVATVQTSGSLVPRSGSLVLVSLISIFQPFHLLPSPNTFSRERARGRRGIVFPSLPREFRDLIFEHVALIFSGQILACRAGRPSFTMDLLPLRCASRVEFCRKLTGISALLTSDIRVTA